MQAHIELIQLITAYTLVGAFVFTVVVTCLSLLGWVKFADASQQKKLFGTLVVQLVVVGVGFFSDFLKFDATRVQESVIRDYMSAPGSRALASDFTESDFSMSKFSRGKFDETLFDGTSFRETVFEGADFSRSNFTGGKFDLSLLDGTSFQGARFNGADFRGADLRKAIIDSETKLPETSQ